MIPFAICLFCFVLGLVAGAGLVYGILGGPSTQTLAPTKELVEQILKEMFPQEAPTEEVSLEPKPHPLSEQKPDYAGPGPACWLCNKGGARLPYGICKECNEFNGVGREENQ